MPRPKRKSIPVAVTRAVLHEAGFKCANPACRMVLTLDIHHLDYVSNDGSNTTENLLALCPNCHRLHHAGHIPTDSLRAWKMLLLSLNEGFDRRSIDILLTIGKAGVLWVSGDGVLECAALVASELVLQDLVITGPGAGQGNYQLKLTGKGKLFVAAWKKGDQAAAINAVSS
jgi:hypothetical protein